MMRHKLRTALSLSPGDWLLLAQAWLLLLAVDLGLRLFPYHRVRAWVTGETPAREAGEADAQAVILRARQMLDVACRYHLYPMTCLRRSLVLQRLLAQRGVAVQLRFGARLQDGDLEAHAWLEYQGMPVGEAGMVEERFVPLVAQEMRT